jgi:hypothetical protein
LLSLNTPIPSNILEAIRKADEARDNLGIVETDYDDAENKYNQEEWSYTQLEEDFIDELSSFGTISRAHQQDPGLLTRFADASSDFVNHSVLDELANMSLDVTPMYSNQEDWSNKQLAEYEPLTSWVMVKGTRSHQDESERYHMQAPLPRSFSEADLDDSRLKWSSVRYRIDTWLLDNLKSSWFQQERLRDALSRYNLEDHDWFQAITRYWYSESPDDTAFRTGDTTVSTSADEQSTSNDVSILPPNVLPSVNLEIQQSTPWHTEAADHEAPLPSVVRKASSTDARTDTMVLKPSIDVCPNPEKTASDRTDSIPISTATQCTRQDVSTHTMTSSSADDRQSFGVKDSSRSLVSSTAYSRDRTAETDHVRSKSLPMIRVDSAFSDGVERRPHTAPELLTAHFQRDQLSFRQPCTPRPTQLFIKILGPKPWTLPLVRLTPITLLDQQLSIQRLDCIPFVSVSDTPFCLPGPSEFLTAF